MIIFTILKKKHVTSVSEQYIFIKVLHLKATKNAVLQFDKLTHGSPFLFCRSERCYVTFWKDYVLSFLKFVTSTFENIPSKNCFLRSVTPHWKQVSEIVTSSLEKIYVWKSFWKDVTLPLTKRKKEIIWQLLSSPFQNKKKAESYF